MKETLVWSVWAIAIVAVLAMGTPQVQQPAYDSGYDVSYFGDYDAGDYTSSTYLYEDNSCEVGCDI